MSEVHFFYYCMAALCSGRWWLSSELEGNLLWNGALIFYYFFSSFYVPFDEAHIHKS